METLRGLRSQKVLRCAGVCRSTDDEDEEVAAQREIEALAAQRDRLTRMHSSRLAAHHAMFHPIWGQMLKAGYQNSMYASLMERFACLYTSHVCNLVLYSPYTKFRGRVDVMAHEQVGIAESERAAVLDSLESREVFELVRPGSGAAAQNGACSG
jgi:5' nucleotidase family